MIKLGLTVRRREKSYQCPCKASCYTCCQPRTFLHTRMHKLWSHPCFAATTPAFGHIQHVPAIHKKRQDAGDGGELREYVQQKSTCFLESIPSTASGSIIPTQKPGIPHADWSMTSCVDSPLSRRSVCLCLCVLSSARTQPLRSRSLPLRAGAECV